VKTGGLGCTSGVCIVYRELDTPDAPSLGNRAATESSCCGRDLSVPPRAKSNPGPELGFEAANEGSVAYAGVAQ